MSYVGGGSDIRSFYAQEPGAVLSTAIDKYMYVTLHKRFDDGFRIAYSRTEEVDNVEQIRHPLVRETFKKMEVSGGVEITSTADIPAKGTGLGSSSSYTVGLLTALHAFQGLQISNTKIAEMACDIEINRCGEPIGKQDQYAAAVGGLKLYEFLPDDTVTVAPVIATSDFKKQLDNETLIFYTGETRSASNILAEQTKNSAHSSKVKILRRMTKLAHEFKSGIECADMQCLGELLQENWSLKTRLASGITNKLIDEMYQAGMQAGARGGKLLGAGAGGFMMFIADKRRHGDIIRALAKYRVFKFGIENSGSQVIYYD